MPSRTIETEPRNGGRMYMAFILEGWGSSLQHFPMFDREGRASSSVEIEA